MDAVLLASNFYSALATAVLFLHGLFILWVIFGAQLVRYSVAVPFDPVGELA